MNAISVLDNMLYKIYVSFNIRCLHIVFQYCKVGVIFSILWMRKLRHRGVKSFALRKLQMRPPTLFFFLFSPYLLYLLTNGGKITARTGRKIFFSSFPYIWARSLTCIKVNFRTPWLVPDLSNSFAGDPGLPHYNSQKYFLWNIIRHFVKQK